MGGKVLKGIPPTGGGCFDDVKLLSLKAQKHRDGTGAHREDQPCQVSLWSLHSFHQLGRKGRNDIYLLTSPIS